MEANDPCVVMISAPSDHAAIEIARALLEEGIAACCSVVPYIRSVYKWQGQIHDEPESLVFCKTVYGHFEQVEARVRALHSYQVPEILMLPVADTSAPYLAWLLDTCGMRNAGTPAE